MKQFISMMLFVFILAGCTDLSVVKRQQSTDTLIQQAHWHKQTIQTSTFPIQAYLPSQQTTALLTIYIEGDGLAWLNRNTPSSDPTPLDPLVLNLALTDNKHLSVYLARPCQYVRNDLCERRYWTSARFSPEIIDSMNSAISWLKQQFHARTLQLVGYSGGGAVAALVVARRDDVVSLVTIAGNLDHKVWTDLHTISPLSDSLNAADNWESLVNIPQLHFVGKHDKTVPLAVAEAYQQRFPSGHKPAIHIVESADHHCCWLKLWPQLSTLF